MAGVRLAGRQDPRDHRQVGNAATVPHHAVLQDRAQREKARPLERTPARAVREARHPGLRGVGADRLKPTSSISVRDYDERRDIQAVRACVIELQEFERQYAPDMPEGRAMVDAYLNLTLANGD